jgi:hypothetical protein
MGELIDLEAERRKRKWRKLRRRGIAPPEPGRSTSPLVPDSAARPNSNVTVTFGPGGHIRGPK